MTVAGLSEPVSRVDVLLTVNGAQHRLPALDANTIKRHQEPIQGRH